MNGRSESVMSGESVATVLRSNLRAIGVMLLAVALQVVGAVLLKLIADGRDDAPLLILAAGGAAVGVVNLARLVVWGVAHRRYALSTTFPLSSLFFPVMLFVAAAFGDTIGPAQIIGALLITSGAFWLTARVRA